MLLLAKVNDLWFALPLIVSVSLVYAATRHESISDILSHAIRVGVWLLGFLGVVLLVLFLVNLML